MDVMIDIETLGTAPDGVIASIGVVKFNYTESPMIDSLYLTVSTEGQCRDFNAKTIDWWLHQSKEAQEALFVEPRVPLEEALESLSIFVGKADRIWANGVSFDLAILKDAYEQHDRKIPWSYNQEMCMRPIRFIGDRLGLGFYEYKTKSGIVLHNALEDASVQAKYVVDVLRTIGNK